MKAQQIPEFPASVWNKVCEYIRGRIKADALKGIMHDGSKGQSYKTGRGADDGTLGVITNLTVNHNLENNENSMIEKINSDGGESGATILPTFFDINLDFTILFNKILE